MNCTDFRRVAREYLEGQLPHTQQRDCEAHERDCAACGALMATARELPCRELCEFLCDYVEDSLPARQREVFERHLGICGECVDYVDSYRTTVDLAKRCCEQVEPVPQALIDAILAAKRSEDDPAQ